MKKIENIKWLHTQFMVSMVISILFRAKIFPLAAKLKVLPCLPTEVDARTIIVR